MVEKITDPKVSADCRSFFENEFDRWGRDRLMMISSTTNKISALTDNPSLFFMLGQKENHINIRQIIDEQYERVLDILKSKRGILDEAAERLLKNEVIEGEELKALADTVSQKVKSEGAPGASQNSHALAA